MKKLMQILFVLILGVFGAVFPCVVVIGIGIIGAAIDSKSPGIGGGPGAADNIFRNLFLTGSPFALIWSYAGILALRSLKRGIIFIGGVLLGTVIALPAITLSYRLLGSPDLTMGTYLTAMMAWLSISLFVGHWCKG